MKSKAVENSEGVNNSNGVNFSFGINYSEGVNNSNGVNRSDGVNRSEGVNDSRGVRYSDGVNASKGINRSEGVNASFGIMNCYGVDKALFLADKTRSFSIFGVEVSEERFDEVDTNLDSLLGSWLPKFNNAHELLKKAKSDWSKVEASDIETTLEDWDKPYEAWKSIPWKAIEYVRSLPEFNEKMFIRITGIDDNNKNVEVAKKKIELIEKANKLTEEANKLTEEVNKLLAEADLL